jgi:SET domain-containing protein
MSKYDIVYDSYKDANKIYSKNYVSTSFIDGAGFGVFAGKKYKKGDTIELSPFVEIENNNSIQPYTFASHLDPNKKLIMLGIASMFNHSEKKENVKFRLIDNKRLMLFYATKDINEDDEIYLKYGDNISF